jgi:hypothetical protein
VRLWIEPVVKQLDDVVAIGDLYRFDRFAAPNALWRTCASATRRCSTRPDGSVLGKNQRRPRAPALSPERGYPEGTEENGIPLRDMAWMDQERGD